MNIKNRQECLDTWQEDIAQTIEDKSIPDTDKNRVLHELDILYNDMWNYLAYHGIPCP